MPVSQKFSDGLMEGHTFYPSLIQVSKYDLSGKKFVDCKRVNARVVVLIFFTCVAKLLLSCLALLEQFDRDQSLKAYKSQIASGDVSSKFSTECAGTDAPRTTPINMLTYLAM